MAIKTIDPSDQRVIFGLCGFSGAVFFGFLAVTVPSTSAIAGDLAKIFAVGFVSALSFYFGARGQT